MITTLTRRGFVNSLLMLLICIAASASAYATDRPNIIVLLADDLGWGDVGYHNPEARTPNIDLIASKGIELDRFYVNPTCSPTRASLLSGQFATTHGVDSPVQWYTQTGLPLDIRILPEYLGEAGYATHLVGKWHLGAMDRNYWPQRRGFDSFYGFLSGGIGYYDHVYTGGIDWQRDGQTLEETGYTTELIAEEAVQIITQASDQKPFFLYVAFNAPHTPVEGPGGITEKHEGRKTFLQMVASLDHGIGRILESLDQTGLSKSTLVIFMSDNGGSEEQPLLIQWLLPPARDGFSTNMFLRDGKASVFEGGVRVPAAVWWPGIIEARDVQQQTMHIADILPTIADLVGFETPSLDGRSQKDAWLTGNISNAEPIIVANIGSEALIQWPWKLVRDVSLPVIPKLFQQENWYLFNIETDPGEQLDLAGQMPEKLSSMRTSLLSYPRRKAFKVITDKDWDQFGGDITRSPWAEAASN